MTMAPTGIMIDLRFPFNGFKGKGSALKSESFAGQHLKLLHQQKNWTPTRGLAETLSALPGYRTT
jgi:hypothetical protein